MMNVKIFNKRQTPTQNIKNRKDFFRKFINEDFILMLIPYFILALLITVLAITQPNSFRFSQINIVAKVALVLIFISIGQTFTVFTGGLDLSVGGVLSVVSALAASFMATREQSIIMIILFLAFGWLPGFINGLLIVYGNIQPFVTTLGAWFFWGGVALTIMASPGGSIYAPISFISHGKFLGIPMSVLILIATIVFGLIFIRTKICLEIRSIGSDREASYFSGIRSNRIILIAYSLSSYFVTLAGLYLSAQSTSGDPVVGNGYILPSFAAVVIGGTSLMGGSGTIVGSIVGAIALTYITSVTFAFRLQPQWTQIIQGMTMIFVLSIHFFVKTIFQGRQER